MSSEITPPPVIWAQRSELVYLTVDLADVLDPTVRFDPDSVYFKGTAGVEKKIYEVTIHLYKSIDPDKCKSANKGRCVELILAKKECDLPYWPSLTADGLKYHWLKCDFNKWQDEDESDHELQDGGNTSDVTLDALDDYDEVEGAVGGGEPQVLNIENH